jgi:hypothetical protein
MTNQAHTDEDGAADNQAGRAPGPPQPDQQGYPTATSGPRKSQKQGRAWLRPRAQRFR